MKRYLWSAMVGAALMLAAGCLVVGCGESAKPTPTPKPKATAAVAPVPPAATTAIAQKICPVMGGPINPKIYVDYQGRRVYFCCNACPEAFKKDPEKYLQKLDAELAGAAASPAAESHEGQAP